MMAAILSRPQCVNPSGADNGELGDNLANAIMVADVLARGEMS